MNSKQLLNHKQEQEKKQDEALDDLINIVKNTKQGGKAIGTELKEQDVILNVRFLILLGTGRGDG